MNRKNILIVDDEQHTRTSLRLIVQRLGHNPVCAQNGSEALELLLERHSASEPFDLMLCDLQMPVITGEELIVKMKQRRINTPVLVITGVGDKESVVRLMRLGCRDFIDKPFSPQEIENRITSLLNELLSEAAENTRTEYMARIGEFARASAHDINNVVGATMGFAGIALLDVGENEVMRERLEHIVLAAKRTAGICHELLSFDPKKNDCRKIKTNLNVIVERVAVILKDVAPPQINIVIKNCINPVWIYADSWQLQHALLNLGFNALDAMPKGGEIRFSIVMKDVDNSQESTVCITVEDTGTGIPPDILPHIFDEGFSTKSKGHGIGLANIRRIVENHGGKIDVISIIDKGTCFTLSLPFNKR